MTGPGTGSDSTVEEGASRPSANRRAARITVFVLVVVVIVLAIGSSLGGAVQGGPTYPPIGATHPAAGAAAATTQGLIASALGGQGLQVEGVVAPYRPAESARLATAPRIVVRAILPADPDRGRIVIYEFVTPNDATIAAQEQAAYVASGVGRVQFATDAQFVIRVVGSTVVFFAWSPSAADPRTADVARALATVGIEVSVPG